MSVGKILRDSNILEAVLASVDEGILIAETNGTVVFYNAAARQLLEVPEDSPIVQLGNVGGLNLKLVITRGLIDLGFDDAVSRRQKDIVEFERWLALPGGSRCIHLRTGLIERERATLFRLVTLRDITDLKRLREEADGLAPEDFVTRDTRMQEVLRQLRQVAPTEAYVLMQGESGTGKNVLVRQLHRLSPRAPRPLIEVNCAAVPGELHESEFFGHVRGAFTGASADRAGRFAAADRGTLFLDEVGEVPLHLQAKFLKAVQERRFEPVGSNHSQTVDVRIVSASNRNLKNAVDARQFRADLYYRLSVITLHIPPLRERKADIPLLIDRFLAVLWRRGYEKAVLSNEALRMLIEYPWPGNVRELENAMEHALICAIDGDIRPDSLPQDIRAYHGQGIPPRAPASAHETSDSQMRGQIMFAIKRCNGNKAAAAKMLGVDRTTLWRRVRKLGL